MRELAGANVDSSPPHRITVEVLRLETELPQYACLYQCKTTCKCHAQRCMQHLRSLVSCSAIWLGIGNAAIHQTIILVLVNKQ